MSRLVSRIRTRRVSRIGARLSSAPMTFARTGPAYLDGTEYASGVPRYPSQSGVRGLLNEEASTNLAKWSEDLTNAAWTKGNLTVTANATTSPRGDLTADKLVESASTAQHLIYQSVLATTSAASFSYYLKAAERTWAFLAFTTGSAAYVAYFNLANGTKGTVGASITADIEDVGDGWYRCSISAASPLAGNSVVGPTTANGILSYAGNGTSGIYAWGNQAEQKAYATTYTPTTSAAVTRNAETLTIPTAGLLVPSQGSVIIRAYVDNEIANGSAYHFLFDHVLGATNQFGLNKDNATNRWRAYSQNTAGTVTLVTVTGVSLSTGWATFGYRISAAELSLWINGAKRGSAASPVLPQSLGSNYYIGGQASGNYKWNQPIAWIAFYDRALSDAEMAAANSGTLPPDFTAHLDFTSGQLKVNQGHPWGLAESLNLLLDAPTVGPK